MQKNVSVNDSILVSASHDFKIKKIRAIVVMRNVIPIGIIGKELSTFTRIIQTERNEIERIGCAF